MERKRREREKPRSARAKRSSEQNFETECKQQICKTMCWQARVNLFCFEKKNREEKLEDTRWAAADVLLRRPPRPLPFNHPAYPSSSMNIEYAYIHNTLSCERVKSILKQLQKHLCLLSRWTRFSWFDLQEAHFNHVRFEFRQFDPQINDLNRVAIKFDQIKGNLLIKE